MVLWRNRLCMHGFNPGNSPLGRVEAVSHHSTRMVGYYIAAAYFASPVVTSSGVNPISGDACKHKRQEMVRGLNARG